MSFPCSFSLCFTRLIDVDQVQIPSYGLSTLYLQFYMSSFSIWRGFLNPRIPQYSCICVPKGKQSNLPYRRQKQTKKPNILGCSLFKTFLASPKLRPEVQGLPSSAFTLLLKFIPEMVIEKTYQLSPWLQRNHSSSKMISRREWWWGLWANRPVQGNFGLPSEPGTSLSGACRNL